MILVNYNYIAKLESKKVSARGPFSEVYQRIRKIHHRICLGNNFASCICHRQVEVDLIEDKSLLLTKVFSSSMTGMLFQSVSHIYYI